LLLGYLGTIEGARHTQLTIFAVMATVAAPNKVLPGWVQAAREQCAETAQAADTVTEDEYRSDALELESACEVLRVAMSRFQDRLANDRRMIAFERAALRRDREAADAAKDRAERVLQAIEQVAAAGACSQAAAPLKQNGSSVDFSGTSGPRTEQMPAAGNLSQASELPTQQPPQNASGGSSEPEQLQAEQSTSLSSAAAAAAEERPAQPAPDDALPSKTAASMVPLTPAPSRTPPPACKKKPQSKAPSPPENRTPQDAEAAPAKDALAAGDGEGKEEVSAHAVYKFPPSHVKRPAPAEPNEHRHTMVKDPPSSSMRVDPPSLASHSEQMAANGSVRIATDTSSLASPSSTVGSVHSVPKTSQTIAGATTAREEVAVHHERQPSVTIDTDDEAGAFDAPPSEAVPPEPPIYRVMPDPALKAVNVATAPPPPKATETTVPPPPTRAAPAHRPKHAPADLREGHHKPNRSNKISP